ncbi:hypothetical protein A0H81_11875 [Grifola frondosa]|uniref:Uncharacterized protein n=1 Tax=Grifola frondosa TaxID=5627 RepID=A0A1C7LTH0_GRIFR|nr:hypothetical protein A0H81_11875 [Grifola frondosa]
MVHWTLENTCRPQISTWAVGITSFDAGCELLESPHVLTKECDLALASSNMEMLLGIEAGPGEGDHLATSGGDLLSFEEKVIAVISPRRGVVDLFQGIDIDP